MTLTADESAQLLALRLLKGIPVAFFRFGDGLIECLLHRDMRTNTCDGEVYSGAMAFELRRIFELVIRTPEAFLGDWLRGPNWPYQADWLDLTRRRVCGLLHFEALLLMRESETLRDFYQAARDDPRRKVFMGPCWNAGAARMLRARHLVVSDHNLFAHLDHVRELLSDYDPEVLLFGAGMAGNIPVVEHWQAHPGRTYINLGSAMDPLFKGRTRSQQITTARARALFAPLLKETQTA